jgi:hypothetical protein
METLQRTANRGSISTGFDIDNSLKLEPDNSEYLHKTPTSSGNRRTFTISMWIKRTEIGVDSYLMQSGDGDYNQSDRTLIKFDSTDNFRFGGGSAYQRTTNRVFRDTSAWYHIVMAVDTTDSTAANRLKLYVNGVQETSFSTSSDPSQNFQYAFCKDDKHSVGFNHTDNGSYYPGYMSEVILIDGQQLDPTSFGEFDEDTGIWKPIDVSGLSFGTNGFYLDFKDSANLGNDASGGTDFTLNNITSADQMVDSPTNNGCTLNVLASLEGSNDITEGALVSTGKAGGGGNFNGTYGTIGIDPFNSTVDWYWEIETSVGTSGSDTDIGIGWIKESRITSGSTAYNNVYADGISRYSSQTANAAGDIWGVLLETGATPVFKLYRNDGLIYTATHGSGGVSFDTLMFPYITVKGTSVDARLNFLNPASSFSIASGNADPNGYGNFEFDPKGGYALCTKNLAEYG